MISEIQIPGKFDIARARATLRLQLMAAQFSPLFVARASIAFTGLCETMLCANDDQTVVVHLNCISGDTCGVVMSSQVQYTDGHSIKLEKARPLLEKSADEYNLNVQNNMLHIMIGLRDKESRQ